MTSLPRRTFLATAAAAGFAPLLKGSDDPAPHTASQEDYVAEGANHRGVAVISSGNGLRATERAHARVLEGADCVNAVVDGVGLVEADPNDQSVGLGGLPNEDGVIQLDASVMHGPSHRAGAVGALENVVHAARVALLVLERTDHVMLVGAGAKRFALDHGFPEQDLMTPRTRQAWLRWRERLSDHDDRLGEGQALETDGAFEIPYTDGTIHCSAVDAEGDLGACTTTSGLSWKIPGRVGDSPIIGAGMYCDNEVGAAGATGRGEAVIQSCGAYAIVREMEAGLDPTDACLKVLERIASRTKRPHLLNEAGEPNFNVSFYALRKDGAWGAASMRPGGSFAIHDGAQNRRIQTVSLFG